MTERKIFFYSIMKYIILAALLGYVVFLMKFQGESGTPFEEMSEAMTAVIDTDNLVRQDGAALRKNFGINSGEYEGVLYLASPSSISAEEILVLHAETREQAEQVKAAIEKRVESRKNDFAGYMPEEEALLENAQVSVRGKYVFYASSPKAQQYREVFERNL